ncbi:IclR family transcriptional regulator [Micromonospora sp. ATA51]|uniref:IclR family transcriptional regulator n=1 Tax=Micromonospora sp. ATA51 TaxID=2806098 RepID=UPI001A569D31|nr:IclR family transcriptional regulator [Micromonospora sp. ATA51]MBM0224425.1 IclR family transcriptional regulator [Micromonospora sp. ATA51]
MTKSATGGSALQPILVLKKVRALLECFSVERPTLTLQQIRQASGLPASTCQRLVQNLVREGFLDRDGDEYRIGLGLVRWSAPGTYGLDLVRLTRPVLQQLRDETGETTCLYVRDGPYRTVVALAETRHIVMRLFRVGMVMALHAGSAGKVFLAYDTGAFRDAVAHGLSRFTPETVTDIDLLTSQMKQVRRDGYAASFEEREKAAASISAPVFGLSGELVAALGIGAPSQRLTPTDVPRLAPLVIEAAADASRRMGYDSGVSAATTASR